MAESRPLRPRYVAVLALAACAILVGGWLARPRDIPQRPAPLPSATELEQLERRAERRALEGMADFFDGVAREARTSIAYLPGAASSGIAWDVRRLVAPPLATSREVPTLAAVVTDAGALNAQPDVWGLHLPLAVLVGGGGPFTLAPARRATAPPRPGDWIVAVWRNTTEPAFAAGNFRQTVSGTCGVTPVQELSSSLSFSRNMLGGGVFDLDGGLLAMILPCRSGFSAVAVESIAAILDHEATIQQRLLGRYGLGVGTLDADEQRHFDTTTGLIVREVWTGSPADVSGFLPGDLVTTVAGKSVTTANDLEPLLTPSQAPFPVAVKRGQRTAALTLSAAANSRETAADTLDAGLVLQSVSGSLQIVDVRRGSRAAAAGIEVGDRLVRVDRAEPRSLRDAQRVLGRLGRSPSLLEVEREGRRLAILLPPPPAP